MNKNFMLMLGKVLLSLLILISPTLASAQGRVLYENFDGAVGQTTDCVTVTTGSDGTPARIGRSLQCNWDGIVPWYDSTATLEMEAFAPANNEKLFSAWFRIDRDVDHVNGSKLMRIGWNTPSEIIIACQFEGGDSGTLLAGLNNQPTFWGSPLGVCADHEWHRIRVYTSPTLVRLWQDNVLLREWTGTFDFGPSPQGVFLMSNWSSNPGWEHDANNHVMWDEYEVFSDLGTGGTGSMREGTITQGGGGGGDTTAPTVSISSPTGTVSGTVTVSASASDNVGVAGVQLRLNGVNLGAEDTASPFSVSWNTTTVTNGTHTLSAIARDAAGNTTTSNSVTVTVSNIVTPPPPPPPSTPLINSVSGSVAHGSTVTVNGSGFGDKSQGAPVVWDDASGTSILSKWDGYWPNLGNSDYHVQYRNAPYRNVNSPHNNTGRFIAGSHGDSAGYNAGYNVMVWKSRQVTSTSNTSYSSWYMRVDPQWYSGSDNNFKIFDYSNSTSPYGPNNWYSEYNGHFYNTSSVPGWHINDNGMGLGSTSSWWGNSGTNPLNGWVKIEMESKYHPTDGFIKIYDNGRLVLNYVGPTDTVTGTSRIEGIGGYNRNSGRPENFRYFADLYLDNTLSRVVLANSSNYSNATVREIQIPTSWSQNSITINVNKGVFATGQSVWLFVVNSDGTVSSTGYLVTIGGTTTSPPPPPPPPSTRFTVGQRVQTTANVNVRATASATGVLLGTQPTGSLGTIVSGGTSVDGYYWWNVNFDSGVDGYSVENYLTAYTTTTPPPPPPTTNLTIDNSSTNTQRFGTWDSSTAYPSYFGSDYLYSSNSVGNWFEWNATNLEPGTYNVSVWWPSTTSGRPTDVSYLVTHSSGVATISNQNQNLNGGSWVLLGTYNFGSTGSVRVQSGATGFEGTAADGVKFEKVTVTPPPPPPVDTVPVAPSSLSASPVSTSQVNLTWSDSSQNETGFSIERKTGLSGTYVEVATVSSNTTTYQNTGLTASTQYYFRVRAFNSVGFSVYSPEATAITANPAPIDSIKVGDRVQTTVKAVVRTSPGGKRLGTQARYARGTVTEGPTQYQGYPWYRVNYDSGVDGWTRGDLLTKVSSSTAMSETEIRNSIANIYLLIQQLQERLRAMQN